MQPKSSLHDALQIMRDLRARCSWDAAQTHDSLRPYLTEETLELDDALKSGDDRAIAEELGDVLLQVLFHSVIAEERGAFDAGDVAHGLVTKMRERHPHLYGNGEKQPWEELKARKRDSITDGLPIELPSLHRAHRLQDRAGGVGFDWPDTNGPLRKVAEELDEVRAELARSDGGAADQAPGSPGHAAIEAELGDLLFSVVNLCRKAGVHASLALDKANLKFSRRFTEVQRLAREHGREPHEMTLAELDAIWDSVKQVE